MAAGDKIFSCRGAKKNTTQIAGATHYSYSLITSKMRDPGGAGAPGPVEIRCENAKALVVTLYGNNINALSALIGSAAENLIIQIYGAAAALEKVTFKNVAFTGQVGPVVIPRDGGGGEIVVMGIEGEAAWASSDTPATMIVAAADS